MKSKVSSTKIAFNFFLLAVFGSMLSQLPNMLESGMSRYLQSLWILPILVSLVRIPTTYISKYLLIPLFLTCIFCIYCGICETIFKSNYIGADMINIIMSMTVFFISYIIWKLYGTKKTIMTLNIILLIGAFILSSYVYRHYLANSDIMSQIYAFKAKNSMGQLLFSAILIVFLTSDFRNKTIKVISWIIMAYTMIIIMMLKSRATIVTIFFVILYIIFKIKNNRIRAFTIIGSLFFITLLFFSSHFYDIFVNGIILNTNTIEDLSNIENFNDVSSGRVDRISSVLPLLPDNLWFGIGNKYVDCMPIIMIVQYGLFGSFFVFALIYFFWKRIHVLDKASPLYLSCFLLYATYLINSLFEAQAPFGPGAKCFLLWVIIGFALAEKEMFDKHIDKNENLSNIQ